MKHTKCREHIISVLNKIISLLIFLGTLIYLFVEIISYDISLSNRFLYFQLPFVVFLSVSIIFYIFYLFGNYLFTHVTIEQNHIKVENRFFLHNNITVPFKNIHSYTIKQSIFYKNLNAVRILINSGSRNDKAEIDVVLNKRVVLLIEDKIKSTHCGVQKTEQNGNYRLSNKWLFFYSILIPSKWLKTIGYTLSIVTVVVLTLTDSEELSFWFVVAVYALAVLISIGLNTVYTIYRYYSYTITKQNDCVLGLNYGKIVNVKHFVLIDKINGILIKEDFFNQLTKTCRPYIYVAGYKNNTEEVSLPFLPLVKTNGIEFLIQKFIKEFHIAEQPVFPPENVRKSYYLPKIIPFNIIFLPLMVFFIIATEYLAIPIFIFLETLLLLNSRLAYKNTSFSCNQKLISVNKGGIFASKLICKKEDIQSIVYINNYFNRKKNIYKLKLFIKAVKKVSFSTGYIYVYPSINKKAESSAI